MAKRNTPMLWIMTVGGIAFVAILIYLSMKQTQQQYHVCMAFKNGTHCATASGSTYDEAVRSAQEIDCQLLAVGRDETMVCLGTQPTSIQRVQK
ncbi:MAG TPA: hypothetical protein VIY69_08670 [Candidatus Acidoferrales bacterium]